MNEMKILERVKKSKVPKTVMTEVDEFTKKSYRVF